MRNEAKRSVTRTWCRAGSRGDGSDAAQKGHRAPGSTVLGQVREGARVREGGRERASERGTGGARMGGWVGGGREGRCCSLRAELLPAAPCFTRSGLPCSRTDTHTRPRPLPCCRGAGSSRTRTSSIPGASTPWPPTQRAPSRLSPPACHVSFSPPSPKLHFLRPLRPSLLAPRINGPSPCVAHP